MKTLYRDESCEYHGGHPQLEETGSATVLVEVSGVRIVVQGMEGSRPHELHILSNDVRGVEYSMLSGLNIDLSGWALEAQMDIMTSEEYLSQTSDCTILRVNDPEGVYAEGFELVLSFRNDYYAKLFEKKLGEHVLDASRKNEEDEDPASVALTELTRQKTIEALGQLGSISGNLEIMEFLERIWDLASMPSTGKDLRCLNARDEIDQHMIKNADWSMMDLAECLRLMQVASTTFCALLEWMVHPTVRSGDAQQRYVAAINAHIERDGATLRPVEQVSGYPVFRVVDLSEGVSGTVKNIIFSADGPKPEIVIADAINNDIEIVKNQEYCLVYDEPTPSTGLLWKDLVAWWAKQNGVEPMSLETERRLYERLRASLASPPEKRLFKDYFGLFKEQMDDRLPALIPQVYLHYDPYTARQLDQPRLPRQRMDFLMLFSQYERIVIEVDGKQHYAKGKYADTEAYAKMVAADRDLRLAGYDIYRFGAVELLGNDATEIVRNFFERLFHRYRRVR